MGFAKTEDTHEAGYEERRRKNKKKELCWSGNLNKFVPSDKPYGFQQIRWICFPMLLGEGGRWNIVSLAITTCSECNLKLCFESFYMVFFQKDSRKTKLKKLVSQK